MQFLHVRIAHVTIQLNTVGESFQLAIDVRNLNEHALAENRVPWPTMRSTIGLTSDHEVEVAFLNRGTGRSTKPFAFSLHETQRIENSAQMLRRRISITL